jgi:hypothetical protein
MVGPEAGLGASLGAADMVAGQVVGQERVVLFLGSISGRRPGGRPFVE